MLKSIGTLFLLVWFIGAVVGRKSSCPARDVDSLEEGRICKKACADQSDCKGARKHCLCDDICGTSCYNPNATCALHPPPDHSRIRTNGQTYGDTITYKCNKGYILNGTSRRTCRSDRKWTGTAPTCIEGCQNPPRSSSTAYPDSTKLEHIIGETLSYSCNFGYNLLGNPIATCMSGGEWDIGNFSCVPVDCGDPGNPSNGYKVGKEYTLGKRIYFECNIGYGLYDTSRNYVQCSTKGVWRPSEIPHCIIIECGFPEYPEHGSVDTSEVDEFSYGAEVTYSCDPGYTLTGNATGRCNENEMWGTLPTCTLVGCDVIPPSIGGFVTTRETKVPKGSSVEYGCNEGYRISGTRSLVCQADLSWSASPPRCVVQTCTSPNVSAGVSIRPLASSWAVGDSITYSCKDNYTLIGNETATCQATTTWSNIAVRCKELPGMQSCPPGYELDSPVCFKLSLKQLTYYEAEIACEKDGATLPVLLNEKMQLKLRKFLSDKANERQDYYWIGLRDTQQEGRFVWKNGLSHQSYKNFINLTNVNDDDKDCGAYGVSVPTENGDLSGWMMMQCDHLQRYVCMTWEGNVRAIQFDSFDRNFNGVYIPRYGYLYNDFPFYVLKGGIDHNNQHHIFGLQNNGWLAASREPFPAFHSNSGATSLPAVRGWQYFNGSSWNYVNVAITEYNRWSDWSEWSSCSLTCGAGYEEQARICTSTSVDGIYCQGPSRTSRRCNEHPCPVEIHPCLPNPCRNNETCEVVDQAYRCTPSAM